MVLKSALTEAENKELDQYLDSYRQRTKLRGKTFEEKLEEVISRWEKIAEDCENDHDNSVYRKTYAESHRSLAKIFRSAMSTESFSSEEEHRELVSATFLGSRNYLFKHCHPRNPPTDPYWSATVDAICYQIVECEAIFKNS